jgi:thiamine biosynthesis lipoprotein
MRETRQLMGMPITIAVVDAKDRTPIERALDYFERVDARFSPYRPDSEVSLFNRVDARPARPSAELMELLDLAEQTRRVTDGYFDVWRPDGRFDPSGLVKGWAIRNAALLIADAGFANYFVDAGGDIQCAGRNESGEAWRIGIRNPFDPMQSVKTLQPGNAGIATSGTSIRGAHIYDPHHSGRALDEIVSLTVVGPDVYEADRFATAAFAMGRNGIGFIDAIPGLEGYAIDRQGIATMSRGFAKYVVLC